MSKRMSGGGGGNTLFNYFTKTPPANKKSRPAEDEETVMTPNALPDTPKNKKNVDQKKKRDRPTPDPPKPTSMVEDQDDDSPVKPRKKRIRLVDSDDSDTENKAANGPSTPKEKISLEKKLQDSFKYEPGQSPQSQDKKKSASNDTPAPKSTAAEPQESSSTPDEGNWVHCRLEWLRPDKIRDARKRRPDDPEYDPRTLFVPDDFRKNQTPAHRQWWDMKASHFDCVLFFKVGKFYELYHMDAAVGVNELGFSYMKGDFAHSGFPESAYARMASTLVSKGYKVARVEQTETPDMMQERCKRTGQNSKFDKVVAREICQVTCRGTEVSSLQDSGPPEPTASYMMAVAEEEINGQCVYGVCFVDTSIGVFHLGQFEDDKHSSRLLTTFAHYPPVLVVYERKSTSGRTSKLISSHCHSARKESVGQFWPPDKTLKTLAEKYYRTDSDGQWPDGLKPFQHEGDPLGLTPAAHSHLAVKALGGCVAYLTDALLDIQVLGMSQFESYAPPDVLNETISQENWEGGNTMVLDAITLRNLRIVGEEGALYDKLNFCTTPMGKRLLRLWVCAPSCKRDAIRERQRAVEELLARQELCQDARAVLQKQPDLERLLAKMHTLGNLQRSKQHPDARAIFYEEKKYSKKKVQDFLAVLGGFKSARQLSDLFAGVESTLLRRITQMEPDGKFPDYESTLNFFEGAFDHGEAEREGRIEPARGVDAEYDAALHDIAEVSDELEDYRKEQEQHFRARVTYVGSDKKRFQLEVSQTAAARATPAHQLEGARKGYKRFSTPTTKELLARMMGAEEQKTNVLKDLSRRIFEKFSSHQRQWESAVQCLATLDILLAFAEFARQQTGDICLPEITVCQDDRPYVHIVEGRHPCIPVSGEFIPNDTSLGGSGRSLLLLTGPNMGGKSTLMRQVGLLTVLAHLGSYVPARECRVSLVDRVFTRLGASDDILSGQSTFLVEMSETAAIVRHATRHSLVLLDELGRGTSTYDGTAIASAVAAELAARACRVVFSTHYHALVEHLRHHPDVLLGHMACMVETEEAADDDAVPEESITFLYRLSDGACPKSYGFNAARLAGVPAAVTRRAHAVARSLAREAQCARAARDVTRAADATQLRALLAGLKI